MPFTIFWNPAVEQLAMRVEQMFSAKSSRCVPSFERYRDAA